MRVSSQPSTAAHAPPCGGDSGRGRSGTLATVSRSTPRVRAPAAAASALATVAASNCQRNLGCLRRHQSEGRDPHGQYCTSHARIRALVARSREANNCAGRQRRHRRSGSSVFRDDRPAGAVYDKFSLRGSAPSKPPKPPVGVAHTARWYIRGNNVRQVRDMAGTRPYLRTQGVAIVSSAAGVRGSPTSLLNDSLGPASARSALDLEEQVLRGRLATDPVIAMTSSAPVDRSASTCARARSAVLSRILDDLRHGVNLVLVMTAFAPRRPRRRARRRSHHSATYSDPPAPHGNRSPRFR